MDAAVAAWESVKRQNSENALSGSSSGLEWAPSSSVLLADSSKPAAEKWRPLALRSGQPEQGEFLVCCLCSHANCIAAIELA